MKDTEEEYLLVKTDAAIWLQTHFSSNLFALFQRAEYFISDSATFLNPEHAAEKRKQNIDENQRTNETEEISVQLSEQLIIIIMGKNYMTQHP